jgi:glycerol kinase
MNLETLDWDDDLLDAFRIPRAILPRIASSSEVYGFAAEECVKGVPVAGILGDQQAALFGQACVDPGMGKNTYGTGSFALLNAGFTPPEPPLGLVSTIAWRIGDSAAYALEASIFATGAAVQWLRDGLNLIERAEETEALAETLEGNDGVYFVPALTGLGSPHWDPYARGTIVGLTRGSGRAHLARATLEAIAYQTRSARWRPRPGSR